MHPGTAAKLYYFTLVSPLLLPQTLASLNPKRIRRDQVNAVPPPASFVTRDDE